MSHWTDGCWMVISICALLLFLVVAVGAFFDDLNESASRQQASATRLQRSYNPTKESRDTDYYDTRSWDRDGDGLDDEYEEFLADKAYAATAHAIDQLDQLDIAISEMRREEEEFKALMTDEAEYKAEWRATERAMHNEYLASQRNSGQTSYVTTNLNVRTGPSTNCPVLSTLDQNAAVMPIYCNTDCSWILLSGSGWVSASYVVSPPLDLYVYTDIPACAYGGSPSVVQQPAPTVARPSCGGGCINPPSGCNIKGNVGYNSGEKIYHVPGQAYYYDTVIDTRYGERWFCTEYEAQAAGWRRAYQ